MDWYTNRPTKRNNSSSSYSPSSSSILSSASPITYGSQQRSQFFNTPTTTQSHSPVQLSTTTTTDSIPMAMATSPPIPPIERNSYYFSQFPLYCSDWTTSNDIECVALSTYKEGSINKLQVVHGITYESDYKLNQTGQTYSYDDDIVEGYYFNQVAEASVDYPITHLQWDPLLGRSHEQRVAASSEVLRLYKVDYDPMDQDYSLVQTHLLANNTASNSTTSTNGNGTHKDDLNTYPPVTSFDWNHTDPNILITSSVDTTCTVWDLHRSIKIEDGITTSATNTATVKTQLIAHDSEVFDVKFIHDSTNIFASVGNDGSMRVFDLRSLEHSTIIYEPALTPPLSANASTTSSTSSTTTSSTTNSSALSSMAAMNSKALLKLSTSNTDQHHLATVGINSNQVIIIDMRMPGLPVATLDGSLGGINHAAINSIKWHPTSNYLLTGGDDCQALIWDCTNLHQRFPSAGPTTTTGPTTTNSSTANSTADSGVIIETPSFAYEEDLEVNNVCWRGDKGDWLGVVSGKGFQGVQL